MTGDGSGPVMVTAPQDPSVTVRRKDPWWPKLSEIPMDDPEDRERGR